MNKETIGMVLLILSYPVVFLSGIISNEFNSKKESPAPFTQEALETYPAETTGKAEVRGATTYLKIDMPMGAEKISIAPIKDGICTLTFKGSIAEYQCERFIDLKK